METALNGPLAPPSKVKKGLNQLNNLVQSSVSCTKLAEYDLQFVAVAVVDADAGAGVCAADLMKTA